LPLWSGSREVLTRSITLPPDLREQLLHRLARLKRELGRGPHIAGEGDTSVVLSVRTSRVRAVTALDVELARRVDSVVEEVVAT
jgi:pterin-4a-carbinolamine dehydratase